MHSSVNDTFFVPRNTPSCSSCFMMYTMHVSAFIVELVWCHYNFDDTNLPWLSGLWEGPWFKVNQVHLFVFVYVCVCVCVHARVCVCVGIEGCEFSQLTKFACKQKTLHLKSQHPLINKTKTKKNYAFLLQSLRYAGMLSLNHFVRHNVPQHQHPLSMIM